MISLSQVDYMSLEMARSSLEENSSRLQRRGWLLIRLIANKYYKNTFYSLFFLPLVLKLLSLHTSLIY